jgi:hypothetical protein
MKNALIGFLAGAVSVGALILFVFDNHSLQGLADVTEVRQAPSTEVQIQPEPEPEPEPVRSVLPLMTDSAEGTDRNPSPTNDDTPATVSSPRITGQSVTGLSGDALRNLGERNFNFWSDNKDRFDVFANEAQDTSAAARLLEESVTSEAWRIAGASYLPFDSVTECRLSACRVRLSYGTPEELSEAAQSNIDLWILSALEPYGFVSADSTPEWDFRALDPDPDAPGEILDVYFWRE